MRIPKRANQVYAFIRHGIEAGKYRIGERIPTERNLARQFKLSRPTVTAAIHRLVAENLIRRAGKAGSIVSGLLPRRELAFGAILWGLSRQHAEESPFGAAGREILHFAAQEHWSVRLFDPTWTDDPKEPGLTDRYAIFAGELIEQKVAGVFLMPEEILENQYLSSTAAVVDLFGQASIPVVLIDRDIVRYPARSRLDLVGIDNFDAGFSLTNHFISLGCRKIDFLAYSTCVPTQEARIAGYLKSLEFHGIRPNLSAVHHGDLFAKDFILEVLQRRRPEAVLVVSDSRASSVMQCAIKAGIRVPEELRIGSFDDLATAAKLPVPLTTIRQPGAGLGYVAFRTMVQRLEQPGLPPLHAELTGELIVRASSGPPVKMRGGRK